MEKPNLVFPKLTIVIYATRTSSQLRLLWLDSDWDAQSVGGTRISFSPFNFIYFSRKAFIYLQNWRERVSAHDLMPIERLNPCVPDTHTRVHTRSLLSTTVCLRVQRYSSSLHRPQPSACCLRLFAFLQRNLSSGIGCTSLGRLLVSLFCFAIRMCVSWVQHAVSSKLR